MDWDNGFELFRDKHGDAIDPKVTQILYWFGFTKVGDPTNIRTCFSCRNTNMCFARRGVQAIVNNMSVNIEGDVAPGHLSGIYSAIARCCLNYQKRR